MARISVEVEGKGRALVQLDGRSPGLVQSLLQILPFSAPAQRWQEEIYFTLPLELEDENPSPSAERGDVSYWSPGPALCIFFGDSQPISAVNHVGRVADGLEAIAQVGPGDMITLRVVP